MLNFNQGVLFPDFDLDYTKSCKLKDSQSENRKLQVLNLHLHSGFPTEGKEGMPLLSPYNNNLPEVLIPFSDRNKKLWSCGLHCYLYDYKFEVLWNKPSIVIPRLQNYKCVIAPDFSVFVDQPKAVNVWNIYRNRWVTSYMQSLSIHAVPSASWGNVDSFEFCFDGLPRNSIIAIGHTAIGKDRSYKKLYRMGVEALIERKRPTKLLVYGAPLDFNPDVEVIYYKGNIQKLRQL